MRWWKWKILLLEQDPNIHLLHSRLSGLWCYHTIHSHASIYLLTWVRRYIYCQCRLLHLSSKWFTPTLVFNAYNCYIWAMCSHIHTSGRFNNHTARSLAQNPGQSKHVFIIIRGRDVAQAIEHTAVKVWILLYSGSILHGECICSLAYFPSNQWPTTGPSKAVVCEVLSVGKCI